MEDNYSEYTPYNLFNCNDILYLMEGVKIRFGDWINRKEIDIESILKKKGIIK